MSPGAGGSADGGQHRQRRREEERAAGRAAEIHQMVILAPVGGAEHGAQHRFEYPRIAGIGDEEQPRLAASLTIRHAVADDLQFLPVLFDLDAADMGRGRFHPFGQFFAVLFPSADTHLLLMHGEFFPSGEVVHIPLGQHVASPRKARVFGAYQRGIPPLAVFLRIRGAVDEAGQIAGIHIDEAGHLFRHDGGGTEMAQQRAGKVKIQVVTGGIDVQQDVAPGGWRGVLGAVHSFEGAQFYFTDGKQRTDLIGPVQVDGVWYAFDAGRLMTEEMTVPYDGGVFAFKDGKLDTSKNGLVTFDGEQFVFAAGQFQSAVCGAWQDPLSGKWVYVMNGQFYPVTDLVSYDGKIFYFVKGVLALDYTGTVQDFNGKPFYVVKGQVVQ